MTMVIEKREVEIVRCGMRKERTTLSECHLKDWNFVSEMIEGLSFYLYKMGSKLIFDIQDGFGYGFEVGTNIPITRPIFVFWNRGKLIPKLSQSWENPSNWVWFGRGTCGYWFCCNAYPSLWSVFLISRLSVAFIWFRLKD